MLFVSAISNNARLQPLGVTFTRTGRDRAGELLRRQLRSVCMYELARFLQPVADALLVLHD